MSARTRDYKILEAVCRGPFGIIHRAADTGRGRNEVLVQFLDGTDSSAVVAALRLQMDRSAELRHPFVARPLAIQDVEGKTCLVYEYSDGLTLGSLLGRAPIPVRTAVEIGGKLARALHAGFDRTTSGKGAALGLVHGDLGPDHIWLARGGLFKVMGFGISPSSEPRDRDAARQRLACPTAYTAPEAQRGVDLHASDVYALGAILAHAITGVTPSYASSQRDWHEAVVSSVTTRVRELSGEDLLAKLISDLMAFEPGNRPGANEVESRMEKLRRDRDEPRIYEWCDRVIPRVKAQLAEELSLADATLPSGPLFDETEEIPYDDELLQSGWDGLAREVERRAESSIQPTDGSGFPTETGDLLPPDPHSSEVPPASTEPQPPTSEQSRMDGPVFTELGAESAVEPAADVLATAPAELATEDTTPTAEISQSALRIDADLPMLEGGSIEPSTIEAPALEAPSLEAPGAEAEGAQEATTEAPAASATEPERVAAPELVQPALAPAPRLAAAMAPPETGETAREEEEESLEALPADDVGEEAGGGDATSTSWRFLQGRGAEHSFPDDVDGGRPSRSVIQITEVHSAGPRIEAEMPQDDDVDTYSEDETTRLDPTTAVHFLPDAEAHDVAAPTDDVGFAAAKAAPTASDQPPPSAPAAPAGSIVVAPAAAMSTVAGPTLVPFISGSRTDAPSDPSDVEPIATLPVEGRRPIRAVNAPEALAQAKPADPPSPAVPSRTPPTHPAASPRVPAPSANTPASSTAAAARPTPTGFLGRSPELAAPQPFRRVDPKPDGDDNSKWWTLAVVAALLVLGILLWRGQGKPTPKHSPAPIAVEQRRGPTPAVTPVVETTASSPPSVAPTPSVAPVVVSTPTTVVPTTVVPTTVVPTTVVPTTVVPTTVVPTTVVPSTVVPTTAASSRSAPSSASTASPTKSADPAPSTVSASKSTTTATATRATTKSTGRSSSVNNPSSSRTTPASASATTTPLPASKASGIPENPPTGTLSVKGDAQSVKLVSSAGSFSAGPLPAGTYTVKATFEGGSGPVEAGTITLAGGQTVTVTCDTAFARCKIR